MDVRLPLYVAAGSAVGGAARYLLSSATTRAEFPLGTFLVNVVGCFLVGLLVFGGASGGWLHPGGRVFLAAGVLGGFTTMSSFSFEALELWEAGRVATAVAYVAATVGTCLAGTWAGRAAGLAWWPAAG
jgi:fluoride exporter